MHRLYHPDLGVEWEAPTAKAAAVAAESGWKPAPDPEPTPPGVVPEPVTYAPAIKPKAKPKSAEPAEGDEK